MIPEEIFKLPKQFCEGTSLAVTKEFFALVMMIGAGNAAFALTPANAKRFSQQLASAVADYEKQIGKIEGDWTNGIPSPIQPKK